MWLPVVADQFKRSNKSGILNPHQVRTRGEVPASWDVEGSWEGDEEFSTSDTDKEFVFDVTP